MGNFSLFGEPRHETPWGCGLFGHRSAINCLFDKAGCDLGGLLRRRAQHRRHRGSSRKPPCLSHRSTWHASWQARYPTSSEGKCQIHEHMIDAAMAHGRIHSGDERHLADAFQDNRVIPFEGVRYGQFPDLAKTALVDLIDQFHPFMAAGRRAVRIAEIHHHLDDAWSSWIGGLEATGPFYFRIQNPVVILELDHHRGDFLTNDTAMPFHIHTVIGTPNGNDYGRPLVAAVLGAGHKLPGDLP
ncbi:DUF3500 domain-containing protein [Mycobacterium colombiense]|uniref:DUF3500 domain-containing protein n=1 Tax=Mycobacterium colombiense TaxID=339268 RepID=UPI0027E27164|nr:DUF3500 domain-containing protein [Mycobacterium colombiense]